MKRKKEKKINLHFSQKTKLKNPQKEKIKNYIKGGGKAKKAEKLLPKKEINPKRAKKRTNSQKKKKNFLYGFVPYGVVGD